MAIIDKLNVGGLDFDIQDTNTRNVVAPVESSSRASKAYAVKDLFIWTDNKVYEVTSDIASGGLITVGTNVKLVTNVSGAIKSSTNAEASARASADTALGTRIDNEANARTAADTALGTRIDQIVAPSGSSPNPAEVTDARIGAGGITYANLGDAIRYQVDDLHTALNDITGVNNLYFTSGYYHTSTLGEVANKVDNDAYVCTLVSCNPGDVIYVKTAGYTLARAWGFLDSNRVVISRSNSNVIMNGETITVPSGAKYVAINNRLADMASGYYARVGKYIPEVLDKSLTSYGYIQSASQMVAPFDDLNTIPTNIIVTYSPSVVPQNAPDIIGYGFTIATFSRSSDKSYSALTSQLLMARSATTAAGSKVFIRMSYGATTPTWTAWQELAYKSDTHDDSAVFISPSLFTKIGVIGDSYASGISTDEGRRWEYSWIQMMAREYGCVGYNFSTGGLTTRTWLTSSYGKTLLENTEACELYFIALGINDSNPDSRHVDLGSISDMSASPLPDTFYGNMQAIFDCILAKNPNAVICLITPMRLDGSTSRYEPYQEACLNIANTKGCLAIDWRDVPFASSSWYINNLSNNHPRPHMYNAIMHAIVDLLSEAIRNNMGYMNGFPNVINS